MKQKTGIYKKDWYITKVSRNANHQQYNTMAGPQMMIGGNTEYEVELTIVGSDFDIGKDFDDSIAAYLQGCRYDWLTPEMLHETLKEKYPERFL